MIKVALLYTKQDNTGKWKPTTQDTENNKVLNITTIIFGGREI